MYASSIHGSVPERFGGWCFLLDVLDAQDEQNEQDEYRYSSKVLLRSSDAKSIRQERFCKRIVDKGGYSIVVEDVVWGPWLLQNKVLNVSGDKNGKFSEGVSWRSLYGY